MHPVIPSRRSGPPGRRFQWPASPRSSLCRIKLMQWTPPTRWDVLKFDYEQTGLNFRMLADIRFRLLALVPTITGAAVALLQSAAPLSALAASTLGLFATLCIVPYELRNTPLSDATMQRL